MMIDLLFPKYGYANARTKAMKSKLMGENRIKGLLAVKSIEEVIELMEESEYKEEVVELSTKYHDVALVNKAVDLNFVKTMKKLYSFLPKNEASELLNLVMEEWTMDNIKAIIASKATGLPVTQEHLMVSNEEQARLAEIAMDNSLDLRSTVHKLANPTFEFSPVFQKIERDYFDKGKLDDFRALFKEIDQYYYNKLGKAADREKNYATKALLLARIDFINSMIVARLKLAGVSKEEIHENIIHRPVRNKRQMNRLIEKETILEVVEEIVNTHKLNPEIVDHFRQTNSLVKLELELERKLIQKALVISKVSVLSFAVMLAYIYLKRQEVAFIKAIAYSTQSGIREEVKELVFSVK